MIKIVRFELTIRFCTSKGSWFRSAQFATLTGVYEWKLEDDVPNGVQFIIEAGALGTERELQFVYDPNRAGVLVATIQRAFEASRLPDDYHLNTKNRVASFLTQEVLTRLRQHGQNYNFIEVR